MNNILVSTDSVLMSVINGELSVLLMKRKEAPFVGQFALPGGLVNENEGLDEAAYRVLVEKLNINNVPYLEQLYTFGSLDREPSSRKRSISVAYMALVDSEKIKTHLNKFASEIEWISVNNLPKLAFDHNQIIKTAMDRLQNKARYTTVGFSLVQKEFTIPELRIVFEAIIGKKLNPTNFRTKLLKMKVLDIIKHKKVVKGRGQPAPVYKLNTKKIESLKNTEQLFN